MYIKVSAPWSPVPYSLAASRALRSWQTTMARCYCGKKEEIKTSSFFPHLIFLIIFYYLCYYSCPHNFSLYPSLRHSPHCCLCPWVMHIFFLLTPSPSFIQPPLSPPTAVSLFHVSVSLFLFCSLDSTYKWDHMVFVFHWLAYLI